MQWSDHQRQVCTEDCGNHKKPTLQCMKIRSCQSKKVRNGIAQKMQGAVRSGSITRDKYALRGSVEIYNAYLEHSRRLWKSYNA